MPLLFWGEKQNRFRFLSASRCSIVMRRSLHRGRQRDRIAQLFWSAQTLKCIYFTELGISIKESSSVLLSRGAVSTVFSNSGWHERALGQELLMEWLIGPVTFYCGSAAEPSCHRRCLLSSAGPLRPRTACALSPSTSALHNQSLKLTVNMDDNQSMAKREIWEASAGCSWCLLLWKSKC